MAYISFQPSDFFSTLLWTGNSPSTQALTGVGFQPDVVWVKKRSSAAAHCLTDSVRGVTETLFPNDNDAETTRTGGLTVFGSDGYTVGADGDFNGGSATFVGWNWKESTTSKCDIVQYSGTGSAQTIAHNLGVKPDLIFIKRTDTTSNWIMYHQSLGATKFMYLNTTAAAETNSGVFNNTEPTTSVFTVNTWNDVNNSSGTYIAYVFASIKGFSKFGIYMGNGVDDGQFINTGFRPAYILIKRSDSTDSWYTIDNKINPYNLCNKYLSPNTSAVVDTYQTLDIVSNGFKIRTQEAFVNASGGDYIYAAFAEFPFLSSNNIPGVAR